MEIHTKYSGTVTISPEDKFIFEHGLPGFEEEKEFALLPFDESGLLYVLQSITSTQTALVITDPFPFFKDYEITLNDSHTAELEVENEKDAAVFTVLTVQDPFQETTANLQAPVILNPAKQKGRQVILSDTAYRTKHKLFPNTPQTVSAESGGR